MHDDPIRILERRLEREREARKEAERLLEVYSSQLHHMNEELVSLNTQLEFKVKERTAALMEARDKAIEGSRAKSEFLAVMSHEIRTPMNGVLGMLKLLQRSSLPPHQKRYTEVALASGESLLGIINDILDYSKLDAGKMQLEQLPFELQAFLEDTAALYSASAQKKGLELVLSLEPPLPDRVTGDPTRLRQVISNLLNNAIKFTEKGHVALHVTCVGENLIHFSVVDSGIGMTDEQQQAIFEPFTQADSSHSRKYGGTGLGLSICRKLVEIMGGRLSVMSAPSLGSEFSFELNLPALHDSLEQKGHEQAGLKHAAFVGKRVLIVDNYWASRVALRNMLKKLRITDIAAVSDGNGALEELQRAVVAGTPYDAVLVDSLLPDMSGAAMVNQLRNLATLAGTLTVLLRNMEENGSAEEADFSLLKPVREVDLNHCLTGVGHANANPVIADITSEKAAVIENGRILLVDDNETNLLVAGELLALLPVHIDSVGNGLDAIEAVKRTQYSLILMDVQMPGIDGLETTRRIRLLGGDAAKIPVIAMTAHTAADLNDACQRVGMNGFISKPLDPDSLIQLVNQHIHLVTSQKSSHEKPPTQGEAPPLADVPSSLPGIDLSRALARVRGNWQVFKKILLSFYNQQVLDKTAFQTALQLGDLKSLCMIAHTLKGSSATVGADGLAAIAARIEKTARESGVDAIRGDVPALYDEWQRVLDGLAPLKPSAPVIVPIATISVTALLEKVDCLIDCLQTDIAEAQIQLETLKNTAPIPELGTALAAAEQHLNRFDIVATKAVLTEIRQKVMAAVKAVQ